MKLLTERKKLADTGKLKMCMAEYDGSWLPYQQPFEKVTVDWLLVELTYDDCTRKEEIAKYLENKFKSMEQQLSKFDKMKIQLKSIAAFLMENK
ncbi:hypothetical protein acsn021_10870 [Anaerocolumna cellulosilytica]|uniref:Uncharacterized protein n=1 Tax=Anaerocolumna cellulosilytica TaxID=433286 RepID=A0A6S6R399_9FIRM|nr:hypothetical protein [Anaerocolumna cellulosilytica]MBB5194574.1 hypothetical protein [Anaerocolumna cellulosilytica]BCJ93518.1 hypothetical protein acsn021_10870 [Anaerocolumna cellulosilytica]